MADEQVKASPADFEYIKMDYSLETAEERVKKVEEIIANTPPERLTQYYLDQLAKYITIPVDKKERNQKYILTENHMKNINRRETSFEGLAGRLENGEDGIYNMITNDKNIIFNHNKQYTKEDIESIPGLKDFMDSIEAVTAAFKTATGRRKFLLKKQLIEMHEDKYEIGKCYKKPIYMMNVVKSISKIDLSEKVFINDKNQVESTGLISLYNPAHVSLLLCNYSKLKEEAWDKFNSDIKWTMEDLDVLVDAALKDKHPYYYDLLIYKIDGKSNAEIRELLADKHGIEHTVEYISYLWRNKIPDLIVKEASQRWLEWHFTFEERGKWKKCSRCGQIKLAHPFFFSRNSTSKDHFYSICKECRNKKKG